MQIAANLELDFLAERLRDKVPRTVKPERYSHRDVAATARDQWFVVPVSRVRPRLTVIGMRSSDATIIFFCRDRCLGRVLGVTVFVCGFKCTVR